MKNNLLYSFDLQALSFIHNEIIIPIGAKQITIDEGYEKLLSYLDIGDYIHISSAEKGRILLFYAELSYHAMNLNTTPSIKEEHFIWLMFTSIMNSN